MQRLLESFSWLRCHPMACAGGAVVLFWVVAALFAPLLAPFDPELPLKPYAKPGTAYGDGYFLLGTDRLGRDILSRLLYGARTVLLYAGGATILALLAGTAAGLVAGYYRGRVDAVLSFVANAVLSFPVLVLYVLILTTVGASGVNIFLAVVFASGPGIMRVVRSLTLDLRNRGYVSAAQLRGESAAYIMAIEILPNAAGPLVAEACLRLGYVIITIGVLGFLGLGLPPPTPDWGGMIKDARQVAFVFPHMALAPAAAISSLVLGFNLLADGLQAGSGRR